MNTEDATKTIIELLRGSPNNYMHYGYDLYIPRLIDAVLSDLDQLSEERHEQGKDLSSAFYDAAWELCRRGIIRPGVRFHGAQATDDGSGGNGYSITPFGRVWLEESQHHDFVPTEPERFAKMFEAHRQALGPGFYERAQEAIRCYGAHAYLACCAMCGAAAESALLAIAIAKTGDEAAVLKRYVSAQGRSRLERTIIGQASERLKRDFQAYFGLLKYWRDEAAHGVTSGIEEQEAYTSLALLLRLAKFVHDNWDELSRTPSNSYKASEVNQP